MAELKVTQVKSGIGTKPKHRGTLRALGLRGIGQTNTLPDRPEIRGRGARSRKLPGRVHAASKAAEQATTAAGGTVEILPKPWGDAPRPPAKGNQHTNR